MDKKYKNRSIAQKKLQQFCVETQLKSMSIIGIMMVSEMAIDCSFCQYKRKEVGK